MDGRPANGSLIAVDRSALQGVLILVSFGVALSTAGVSVMLLTAALFPAWRRSQVNRVWLYMSGTKLLYTYVHSLRFLSDFDYIRVPPLRTEIGMHVHLFLDNYFFLVSCSWMVAGAWLARGRLVVVLNTDPRYLRKAGLWCWLSGFPCSVAARLVDHLGDATVKLGKPLYYLSREDKVKSAIGSVHVLLAIVCSVCLYSWVLLSVWRSGRESGRHRDPRSTTVLALMFALTSGVQYVFIILREFYPYDSYDDFFILLKVTVFVVNYNVPIYSVLFIVGVKKTRKMWTHYLCSKLSACNSGKVDTEYGLSQVHLENVTTSNTL